MRFCFESWELNSLGQVRRCILHGMGRYAFGQEPERFGTHIAWCFLFSCTYVRTSSQSPCLALGEMFSLLALRKALKMLTSTELSNAQNLNGGSHYPLPTPNNPTHLLLDSHNSRDEVRAFETQHAHFTIPMRPSVQRVCARYTKSLFPRPEHSQGSM